MLEWCPVQNQNPFFFSFFSINTRKNHTTNWVRRSDLSVDKNWLNVVFWFERNLHNPIWVWEKIISCNFLFYFFLLFLTFINYILKFELKKCHTCWIHSNLVLRKKIIYFNFKKMKNGLIFLKRLKSNFEYFIRRKIYFNKKKLILVLIVHLN